jgi:hypothetical protein
VADQRILIVLDNCEHVLEGAVVVTRLMETCHGTWSRTGDREVTITHVGIAPDAILPSGERVSFVSVKVREKLTFDGSGNSYTGVWHAEFFDPWGNTMRTGSGAMEGARIVVNPLDTD